MSDDGDVVCFGPPISSYTVRARVVSVQQGEPLIDPDEFADDIELARLREENDQLRARCERLRALHLLGHRAFIGLIDDRVTVAEGKQHLHEYKAAIETLHLGDLDDDLIAPSATAPGTTATVDGKDDHGPATELPPADR